MATAKQITTDVLNGKATLFYAKFHGIGWQMYLTTADGINYLSTLDGRHAKRNYEATMSHIQAGGYLIPAQFKKLEGELPAILQEGFRPFDANAQFTSTDGDASF